MLLQCFSWSFRRHRQLTGLNPCSNGIWSLTYAWTKNSVIRWRVLILVLMEYGLWHGSDGAQPLHAQVLILVLMEYGLWRWSLLCIVSLVLVLILVLMEYGLWHEMIAYQSYIKSLNPCSNGIWSLTIHLNKLQDSAQVLILVLMEYCLWRRRPPMTSVSSPS